MGKPGAGGEETKGEVSFTGNPFKPLVHSQPMITNRKTPTILNTRSIHFFAMLSREWLSSIVRDAKEEKTYSRTPEPPQRDNSFDSSVNDDESHTHEIVDPSSIVFHPYRSSSSSTVSDNGELSEEIIPVCSIRCLDPRLTWII